MTVTRTEHTQHVSHGMAGRVAYTSAWTFTINGHPFRINVYRDAAYGIRVIVFDMATNERLHTWHTLANGQPCDAGGYHGHYEHPEMGDY